MLFAPLGVVIAVVSGAARWNWHSVVLLMLTDLMPEEPQQGVLSDTCFVYHRLRLYADHLRHSRECRKMVLSPASVGVTDSSV